MLEGSRGEVFSVQTTSPPPVDYLESSFVKRGGCRRRLEGPITRRQGTITLSFLVNRRRQQRGLAAMCVSTVPAVISSCTPSWLKPSIDHRARADTPWKSGSRYRLSRDVAPDHAVFTPSLFVSRSSNLLLSEGSIDGIYLAAGSSRGIHFFVRKGISFRP